MGETFKGDTAMRDDAYFYVCNKCDEQIILRVNLDDMARWENGELIQNAMPYLSADERELLISGTCGECFDKMFS
jgi:hypothetical protein